jgi:acetyl esterase/lipase
MTAHLLSTFVVATLIAGPASAADPPALVKKTHTYKTVGEVNIQADVYRPDDRTLRPVVVWIHGGALITGSKSAVPNNLLTLCRDEGYALVSIDYRLAPEVKLPELISDVEDCFAWLRKDGPGLVQIDPARMVISGGSAGGYLTLAMGARLKEKPKALVAYWGYGDVDGEWYTKPSEHYRKTVPLIAKDEAYKAVNSKPLTGSEANFDGKARGRLYLHFRQNGLWTKEVTGFDPTEKAKLDPYCPVRNVTKDYPPTMLVHGTEDTDVPYELSANMAREFEKHKVPHAFITVKGAGHGLAGGDKKLVADAHEKALQFIRAHLKAKE